MSEQQQNSQKAYNLKITPKDGSLDTTPTSAGTRKIKFRGTFEQRGKTVERTVVAQGKAAELIDGMIKSGVEIGLRCVFNRAPANEDGKKGGEFLAVVALPREQEQKAA